jgi:hypothetical protein
MFCRHRDVRSSRRRRRYYSLDTCEELVSADARLSSENEYLELLLRHCVNLYSTEIVKKLFSIGCDITGVNRLHQRQSMQQMIIHLSRRRIASNLLSATKGFLQ